LISIAISRRAQADLLLPEQVNELLALTSSEHARHARGDSRRRAEGHPPRRRECCAAEEKIVRGRDAAAATRTRGNYASSMHRGDGTEGVEPAAARPHAVKRAVDL